ncbi:MAG: HNH endonuclease, partial [Bacteroidetes bacterium]|nr:HNH endonuclease [Bacteroidota bacterium]
NWMKDVDKNSWYWAHWNNLYFSNALNGDISHNVATFLLWKYECYLESGGKGGYRLTRYDKIEKPELEHIAPQTEPKIGGVEAGYCEYDEEFHNEYKNSLGNFLLLSKPHNGSASNRPFKDKRASYNYLAQQRIIQQLTKDDLVWNKSKIEERKNILKQFVLDTF